MRSGEKKRLVEETVGRPNYARVAPLLCLSPSQGLVAQGRRAPQAQNVSRLFEELRSGVGTLTVLVEVEAAAACVLVEHFDPDELYEAMTRGLAQHHLSHLAYL